MKVQFSFVGFLMPDGSQPSDIHINLSQIPREGEILNIKDISQSDTYVRTVVWYLTHGDEGEELEEPLVYVVVGPSRQDLGQSRLQEYLTAPRESELRGDDKSLGKS